MSAADLNQLGPAIDQAKEGIITNLIGKTGGRPHRTRYSHASGHTPQDYRNELWLPKSAQSHPNPHDHVVIEFTDRPKDLAPTTLIEIVKPEFTGGEKPSPEHSGAKPQIKIHDESIINIVSKYPDPFRMRAPQTFEHLVRQAINDLVPDRYQVEVITQQETDGERLWFNAGFLITDTHTESPDHFPLEIIGAVRKQVAVRYETLRALHSLGHLARFAAEQIKSSPEHVEQHVVSVWSGPDKPVKTDNRGKPALNLTALVAELGQNKDLWEDHLTRIVDPTVTRTYLRSETGELPTFTDLVALVENSFQKPVETNDDGSTEYYSWPELARMATGLRPSPAYAKHWKEVVGDHPETITKLTSRPYTDEAWQAYEIATVPQPQDVNAWFRDREAEHNDPESRVNYLQHPEKLLHAYMQVYMTFPSSGVVANTEIEDTGESSFILTITGASNIGPVETSGNAVNRPQPK